MIPALVAAALAAAATAPAAATAAGPSHAAARRYAHRTYVVQPGFGRRRFALQGPRVAVRAADGSTITAWNIVVADSGDGTGQAVLLFRGRGFLGWASAYDTVHLAVEAHDRAIRVRYGAYRGNDPFCCPSRIKTVGYRWNGRRIVADGAPPKPYGHRGSRLHLSG
jgi:LppP/LprE lipoprotein